MLAPPPPARPPARLAYSVPSERVLRWHAVLGHHPGPVEPVPQHLHHPLVHPVAALRPHPKLAGEPRGGAALHARQVGVPQAHQALRAEEHRVLSARLAMVPPRWRGARHAWVDARKKASARTLPHAAPTRPANSLRRHRQWAGVRPRCKYVLDLSLPTHTHASTHTHTHTHTHTCTVTIQVCPAVRWEMPALPAVHVTQARVRGVEMVRPSARASGRSNIACCRLWASSTSVPRRRQLATRPAPQRMRARAAHRHRVRRCQRCVRSASRALTDVCVSPIRAQLAGFGRDGPRARRHARSPSRPGEVN